MNERVKKKKDVCVGVWKRERERERERERTGYNLSESSKFSLLKN